MWKKAVVLCFDFLTKSFRAVTECYHYETSQNFYVSHLNISPNCHTRARVLGWSPSLVFRTDVCTLLECPLFLIWRRKKIHYDRVLATDRKRTWICDILQVKDLQNELHFMQSRKEMYWRRWDGKIPTAEAEFAEWCSRKTKDNTWNVLFPK